MTDLSMVAARPGSVAGLDTRWEMEEGSWISGAVQVNLMQDNPSCGRLTILYQNQKL